MRRLAPRSIALSITLAALAPTLVVAVLFGALVNTIDGLAAARGQADRARVVAVEAAQLERLVVDAETSQRGFIITGDERFLEPLTVAREQLPARTERLAGLVGAGATDAGAVRRIDRQIDSYLSDYIAPTVAVARRSAVRARRIVAAGEGRRRVDALRVQLGGLVDGQRRAADERTAMADARAARAIAFGVGGVVLAVLLGILAAVFLSRAVVIPVRRVARTAGRLSGGDLAARIHRPERYAQELCEMGTAFNAMAGTLEAQRDEVEAQHAELESYAGEIEAQRGELERAVADLGEEKSRVEASYAFGEAMAAEGRLPELEALVLRRVADAAGATVGAIWLRDPERDGALTLRTTRGLRRGDLPAVVHAEDGLAGRAIAERRALSASQAGGAVVVSALGRDVTLAHELHVPLVQDDTVVGVMTLGRVADTPFAAAEREVAGHIVGQAAVALAKAIALREVRRREAITRAVLESTPDAIGLFDDEGRPVLANEPMRELLHALGDRAVPQEPGQDVVQDEIELDDDGRILARYAARLEVDGPGGRLVVLRDVSDQRQAERVKDEFFALVSHELRTPLTSVVGYVDLLREEASEADPDDLDARRRAKFLTIVDRNARRLLRLVGDLLFVAQVEAGRLALVAGAVDVGAVARESVDAARPRAEGAGIELGLHADDVPVFAGDADRIGQALDNLLSNALKFTPEGGRVDVTVRHRGDRVRLSVIDTGMGISEADQMRLFERFFRTASVTDARIPGVGLGLTITRAIVEGHRGEIALQSALGGGTTFTIELPLRAVAPAGTAAPAQRLVAS